MSCPFLRSFLFSNTQKNSLRTERVTGSWGRVTTSQSPSPHHQAGTIQLNSRCCPTWNHIYERCHQARKSFYAGFQCEECSCSLCIPAPLHYWILYFTKSTKHKCLEGKHNKHCFKRISEPAMKLCLFFKKIDPMWNCSFIFSGQGFNQSVGSNSEHHSPQRVAVGYGGIWGGGHREAVCTGGSHSWGWCSWSRYCKSKWCKLNLISPNQRCYYVGLCEWQFTPTGERT